MHYLHPPAQEPHGLLQVLGIDQLLRDPHVVAASNLSSILNNNFVSKRTSKRKAILHLLSFLNDAVVKVGGSEFVERHEGFASLEWAVLEQALAHNLVLKHDVVMLK